MIKDKVIRVNSLLLSLNSLNECYGDKLNNICNDIIEVIKEKCREYGDSIKIEYTTHEGITIESVYYDSPFLLFRGSDDMIYHRDILDLNDAYNLFTVIIDGLEDNLKYKIILTISREYSKDTTEEFGICYNDVFKRFQEKMAYIDFSANKEFEGSGYRMEKKDRCFYRLTENNNDRHYIECKIEIDE